MTKNKQQYKLNVNVYISFLFLCINHQCIVVFQYFHQLFCHGYWYNVPSLSRSYLQCILRYNKYCRIHTVLLTKKVICILFHISCKRNECLFGHELFIRSQNRVEWTRLIIIPELSWFVQCAFYFKAISV